MGMLRLLGSVVTVNVSTVGAVMSTTTGRGEANTAETLPAASFAQGYKAEASTAATLHAVDPVPD